MKAVQNVRYVRSVAGMPSRGALLGAAGGLARGPTYLRVTTPVNLDLALEGLVRKVLREQPKQEDIYSFAAEYFETLLEIRDRAGKTCLVFLKNVRGPLTLQCSQWL